MSDNDIEVGWTREDAEREHERIQELRQRIPEVRKAWTVHELGVAQLELEFQIMALLNEFNEKTAVRIRKIKMWADKPDELVGADYVVDVILDI